MRIWNSIYLDNTATAVYAEQGIRCSNITDNRSSISKRIVIHKCMRGGKLCLTISYKFAFIRYAVNLTPGLEYARHKQRGSIWRDLSKCLHGHMAIRIFRCIICMTPGRYTVRVLVLSPAVGIKYDRRMLMPIVCQIETTQTELTVPHVLQYRLA